VISVTAVDIGEGGDQVIAMIRAARARSASMNAEMSA
jgi:hypothetical protein